MASWVCEEGAGGDFIELLVVNRNTKGFPLIWLLVVHRSTIKCIGVCIFALSIQFILLTASRVLSLDDGRQPPATAEKDCKSPDWEAKITILMVWWCAYMTSRWLTCVPPNTRFVVLVRSDTICFPSTCTLVDHPDELIFASAFYLIVWRNLTLFHLQHCGFNPSQLVTVGNLLLY